MAKHQGRGTVAMNYPIGMNLGGDPSQALVHSNPDGQFTVTLSSIDLGQGMKSVTRQIAAETLGVPIDHVYVDTADSDTGAHCMGSFASRGTHRVGNAVIAAAKEARAVLIAAAARELEVNPADLETDGAGNILIKGAPERSISVKEASGAAQFKYGESVSGSGIFLIPLSDIDMETGEMNTVSCFAHCAMIVDLMVDDETGEISDIQINSAYEVGRALNPKLMEQQLIGGAWMGLKPRCSTKPLSHVIRYETTCPMTLVLTSMPGPADTCHSTIFRSSSDPAPDGPFGGKGPGEMCANPVLTRDRKCRF
jgi:CO/xanthine dehydrogenase Mo-binding subunit